MNRRTRNLLCIWIIFIGLGNFLTYTIMYAYIGGDAANGQIVDGRYFVRGHFMHSLTGKESEVTRGVWIYSYLHSISIWLTVGAILLSMLMLARPHIIATMKEGFVRGPTVITVLATAIVLIVGMMTAFFSIDFVREITFVAK